MRQFLCDASDPTAETSDFPGIGLDKLGDILPQLLFCADFFFFHDDKLKRKKLPSLT